MESEAVEAYLVPNREALDIAKNDDVVAFVESDVLDCGIEMDEMCRDAIKLDIDSCAFEVGVIEVGLPAQCRSPMRNVASDILWPVGIRCGRSQ